MRLMLIIPFLFSLSVPSHARTTTTTITHDGTLSADRLHPVAMKRVENISQVIKIISDEKAIELVNSDVAKAADQYDQYVIIHGGIALTSGPEAKSLLLMLIVSAVTVEQLSQWEQALGISSPAASEAQRQFLCSVVGKNSIGLAELGLDMESCLANLNIVSTEFSEKLFVIAGDLLFNRPGVAEPMMMNCSAAYVGTPDTDGFTGSFSCH